MQTHPQSAEVQEQACGAPCNLAVDDEIGMRIASAGGIEAVVKGHADARAECRRPGEWAPARRRSPASAIESRAALDRLEI